MQGLVPSCSKEKEKRGKVGAMLRGGGGSRGVRSLNTCKRHQVCAKYLRRPFKASLAINRVLTFILFHPTSLLSKILSSW